MLHHVQYLIVFYLINLIIQKVEAFEERMFAHPLHKDSELDSLYGMYEKKAQVSLVEFSHFKVNLHFNFGIS